MQPLLKLLQISSPALPTGAFSFSQGIEWAVEERWIVDRSSFDQWLREQLNGFMANQELPLLQRLFEASATNDVVAFTHWDHLAIAVRETAELRLEERHRGRALVALLDSLGINLPGCNLQSQLAGFALFCQRERIALDDTLQAYAYSWLDNQVTAGIKLIPLGQSEGQGMLYSLGDNIQQAVVHAQSIHDEDIGFTAPAAAMASCFHETQYCRLYRS
jgi:urease accessory protein